MASSSGRQRKAQKRNREEGEEQGASATTNESDEKFTFFFGAESPFSQWHYVTFTVDGVQYNCAEQYMMHQKAGKQLAAGDTPYAHARIYMRMYVARRRGCGLLYRACACIQLFTVLL